MNWISVVPQSIEVVDTPISRMSYPVAAPPQARVDKKDDKDRIKTTELAF